MGIRAIPTRYKGYHFRSRLEARWAVAFDAFGIEWQYEPEGFNVGNCGTPYLPDFLLPKWGIWIEVKGDRSSFDWRLMACAVDWGVGLPGTANAANEGRPAGLLLLSQIPERYTWWPLLRHQGNGVEVAPFAFLSNGGPFVSDAIGAERIIACHPVDQPRPHDPGMVAVQSDLEQACDEVFGFRPMGRMPLNEAPLRAARSARFEHGHKGAS